MVVETDRQVKDLHGGNPAQLGLRRDRELVVQEEVFAIYGSTIQGEGQEISKSRRRTETTKVVRPGKRIYRQLSSATVASPS
jgi:hypothetical protein